MDIGRKIRNMAHSVREKYFPTTLPAEIPDNSVYKISVTDEPRKPSQNVDVRLATGPGYTSQIEADRLKVRAFYDSIIEQMRMIQNKSRELRRDIERGQ